MTFSSKATTSPFAVPVLSMVPACSSMAARELQVIGETLRGKKHMHAAVTVPFLSINKTSMGKRMPKEWTCLHPGSTRASPGSRPSRPIRPRRLSSAVHATVTSPARTCPRVLLTTLPDGKPFPEIWRSMPNPVDVSLGSAGLMRPVLRPLHVRLSSPGNSRRASAPNPAWFSPDSACSAILPVACDTNCLYCLSRNARDKRHGFIRSSVNRATALNPSKRSSHCALAVT